MTRQLIATFFMAALFGSIGFAKVVAADDSGMFDGKIITYIVGSEAGGGYDRYARLIAPFLQKHLPGSRLVVVNRPAAGGVVALNELYAATPDGLTIMAINSGLLLSQIAGRDGIEFDLTKVGWLGKAGAEARIVLMQEKTGIRSIEDLQADGQTKIFVTSGFGSASYIQTKLFGDAFQVNMKVLPGFGGNEAEAALIKGEIDGILTSESNAPSVINSGTARAILRFGDAMIEQFGQLPDGMTIAKTANQKLVAEKIAAMNNLGRLTLTAPAIGKEILDSLRNAYAQALSDPDLLAEAVRQGLPIDFQDGSAVEAGVRSFLHQGDAFAGMVAKTLVKE